MSVYTYDIVSWDPVHTSEGVKAMIYLKPDLKLLNLFNKSPMFNTMLVVEGTDNNLYNGRVMFGKIDKSSDVPSYRQNFFNYTGLYVITLDTNWNGYPKKNGKFSVSEGVVRELIDTIEPRKIEEKVDKKDDIPMLDKKLDNIMDIQVKNDEINKENNNVVYAILLTFIIIVIVLIILGLTILYNK